HGPGVAVPARITPPDRAEDEEPGRFQVELLGGLLPDARPLPAAARAELLGGTQVVDDLAALEVLGQRRAAVLITSGGWLLDRRHRRWGAALAAAEPVLQRRVQLGRQLGDPGFELPVPGEQLPDHRLERGNVGR